MSKEPLISVALVTYNHEAYIAAAIESILNQDYPSWELVVVNDGSTDATADIIESFADPRIRLINQQNSGPGAAVNKSLQNCRGEFVALLSGDDICLPSRLRIQHEIYTSRQLEGVLFGGCKFIDELGQPIEGPHFLANVFQTVSRSRSEILRQFFFRKNFINAITTFGRLSVFKEFGYYDPSLYQLQDFDMWIKVVKGRPLDFHDDAVVGYRIRDDQGNLSALTKGKKNRLQVEHNLIQRKFFEGMSDDLFKEAFGHLLRYKECATPAEICFEQAMLLLDNLSPGDWLLGIERLQTLLASNGSASQIAERYQFTPPAFASLLQRVDLLSDEESHQTRLYLYTSEGDWQLSARTPLYNGSRFELNYALASPIDFNLVQWALPQGLKCEVKVERVVGHHADQIVFELVGHQCESHNGETADDGTVVFSVAKPWINWAASGCVDAITITGSWVFGGEVEATDAAERKIEESEVNRWWRKEVRERDVQILELIAARDTAKEEHDVQISELTAARDTAKMETANVYSSLSWRVTRPLRMAGRLLSSIRETGLQHKPTTIDASESGEAPPPFSQEGVEASDDERSPPR